MVRSRSPLRISFGGGGTDVPPYCDEKGGCVVSATINKYSYATLESRSDSAIRIESADFLKSLHFGNAEEMSYNNELDLLKAAVKRLNTTGMGMNVFMRSDAPPKSGLGGSAAAFAAMIGVFNHLRREKKMTDYEVAELAYKIERDELGIGGGRQDQYATVFGGLNYIEFGDGVVRVNPLRMKQDHILELEKHLVLVYLGNRAASTSGDIIADQTRSFVQRKEGVVDALDRTKAIAEEMRYALLKGDLMRFGSLLDEAWSEKKKFSPMITSRYIDDVYAAARACGALGGKITGAGGGGFMLFFCNPNREHVVIENMEARGLKPLTVTFDWDGLMTWEPELEAVKPINLSGIS